MHGCGWQVTVNDWIAHHFFALKRHGACYLTFAVLICDTFGETFLVPISAMLHAVSTEDLTFVNTAIEAYVFPKLIPTTLGVEEAIWTLPFGTAIFSVVCKMQKILITDRVFVWIEVICQIIDQIDH